jgi:PDZ domain
VVPLKPIVSLVPGPRHDKRPTYLLFAGIVFMPLTYDYLAIWDWKEVSARYRHYYNEVLRALQAPVGGQHVLELDYHGVPGDSSDYHHAFGTRLVIDAQLAARATSEVLAQYGIANDRSADLEP